MSKKTSKPRVATLKVKKGPSGQAYLVLAGANGEPMDVTETFDSMSNAQRGKRDRVKAYADVVREHGYVCYLPAYCDACGSSYDPETVGDRCDVCGDDPLPASFDE